MRVPFPLPAASPATTDLVAIGECSVDTIIEMTGYPRPDEKRRVARRLERPGGQAATAALCARRLGWRTRFLGPVGDDVLGFAAVDRLVTAGVDVRVEVCRATRTRTALILVDTSGGTRTVLEDRDPALRLADGHPDPASISSGRILLVDTTDPAAALRAATVARRAGMPVMIDADAVSHELDALLELTDVVVFPERLMCEVGGSGEVEAACRAVAARFGSAMVIATLGREGSLAIGNGETIRTRGVTGEVVDTTGAGDAFRGGFAAGWLDGGPDAQFEDVLTFANAVAAEACQGLGAQEGLPVRGWLPGRFNPDAS